MEFFKRVLSSIILIPLVFFFIIKGYFFFNFFIFIIFCISLYEWKFISRNNSYFILGFLFLMFSFYSVFSIRSNEDVNSLFLFIFVLTVCISTDIGGYFFGKILKGPKLTKISPKKTYSGVIGGYLFAIFLTYYLYEYSYFFTLEKNIYNINVFMISVLISTSSQLGDILVSYFKRLANVKDTGKLIPGHGGVLDRIDGMIFAFPFFYTLNLFLKIG